MEPRSDRLDLYFTISILGKGVIAFFEIIAGIGAYLLRFAQPVLSQIITGETLSNFVRLIFANELIQDPQDRIAQYFLTLAGNFTWGSFNFAAIYLLGHGIVKLWLVVGLFRRNVSYYPLAIIVFLLFIAYQIYRYTLTHGFFLLFLTAVDAAVVVLTWLEYRKLRHLSS